MIKTKVSIERIINERQYQFISDYEATMEEGRAVLVDILKYWDECIERNKQKAKKAQEEAQAACCQGVIDAVG